MGCPVGASRTNSDSTQAMRAMRRLASQQVSNARNSLPGPTKSRRCRAPCGEISRRGKNSGHVGGFAGPLAKAGSGAGRLGREGKQKLTTAAPAAADGGSAQRLLRVSRVVFVKTG